MKRKLYMTERGKMVSEYPPAEKEWNVLAIGDMHVGSYYGLARPVFTVKDEVREQPITIHSNAAQRNLYSYWCDMADHMSQIPLDAVIVNGDVCEGQQYKQRGAGVWTTDIFQQADEAVELLLQLRPDCFYITAGTGYHSKGTHGLPPIEEYIADKLRTNGRKAVFAPEMLLDIGGKRFHIAHKIGVTSSTGYRTTAIAKEIMTLLQHAGDDQYGKVDVALRSHAHYFTAVKTGDMVGVIIPGWKARDEFALMIGGTWCPHTGYVLLKWGEGEGAHVHVEEKLFPSPAPACQIVDHIGGKRHV